MFIYILITLSIILCFNSHYSSINNNPKNNDYYKWDGKNIECYECSEKLELVKVKDRLKNFLIYVRKEKDFISNVISKEGDWYDCKEIEDLWNGLPNLNKEDYFMDVGGNIGICSFHMLNKNIKTITIEPIPNNLHIMTKSLLYNPEWIERITLYKNGLGNKTDTKIINIEKGNWGGSSILNLNQNYYKKNITIVKLDYLLQNFKHKIHLASIDIQGYEFYMLEGAKETLQKGTIRNMYMEIWCDALGKINVSENDIYNLLEKYNYKIKTKYKCIKKNSFNIIATLLKRKL